jgi:hypothetical protein
MNHYFISLLLRLLFPSTFHSQYPTLCLHVSRFVMATIVTNLGPLTATYSPSGANCNSIFQTNPGNALLYGTTDASTLSCFPTNFNPYDGYYYSPGICPSGYDYACRAGVGGGGTAATCCPTYVMVRKEGRFERKIVWSAC